MSFPCRHSTRVRQETPEREAGHFASKSRAALAAAKVLSGVMGLLTMAGCATVGPDYHPPESSPPEKWSEAGNADSPVGEMTAATKWWTLFSDPTLNDLVEKAVAANHDLRIARARILQARAQHLIARKNFGPTLDGSAGYTRERASINADSSGGRVSPDSDLYQAGFDAAWEIDLFGKKRRAVEAARAEVSASEEMWGDTLVTLVGEVARNFIEMRGLQQRLVLARATIATQEDALELARVRFTAGLTSELDVVQAVTLVTGTRSDLPTLEAQRQKSIHRLAVLLGREPGALLAELSQDGPVPSAPPDVPVGLPADLLRRRPDVRAAERRLAAATAQIGVQTAELFPTFSLTGSAGLASASMSNWWESGSRFWSFGPTVQWRIFDAGRIRAAVRVKTALQDEALADYEKTVLTSLQEVEDALVDYAKERVRHEALRERVASAARAVELASELYRNGLTDFLNVLDARRSQYQAEDLLAQSTQAVSTNLVALYKALGGGWGAFAIPETERAVALKATTPTPFPHQALR
ncbi:MAG: efflux transporter outer membrane subunit [Opitutaceae bacterium]|jgi:NodT family efflux transporter outer membrane factor (OMF) lipoprotein